ncbi:MAG: adenylate/guanylate cyclase domain-containing protein [Solirubrobacteraceae bacterium]|nr:adenylate/guanylate cyclase domain-containing protein [Solirubrobacteraceae bacterium]
MPVRPDPLRAAFLVTDIVGSTALADRIGDHRWYELLVAHRKLVRDEAALRGGREVSFRGDGFVLAFDLSASAAQCAIAIQRACGDDFRVRIGLHTGGALRHESSVIGRAVTHACRLAEAAQPGEILLSPLAAGEAGMVTDPVTVSLKGLSTRLPARRLSWDLTATGRFARATNDRSRCA